MLNAKRGNLPEPTLANLRAGQLAQCRRKAGWRIRNLIAMQDVLLARVLDPATSSKDCAACSCAYDRIEERIRVLRGEGAPKTVTAKNDPDAKPRRQKPISEATPLSK